MSTAGAGPADPDSPANRELTDREPTASPEPTANPEQTANPEPTANRELTAGREPTAEPERTAGPEQAAHRKQRASSGQSVSKGQRWVQRLVLIVVAVLVGLLAYFVVAAFIPRWWAQRVAHQVDSKFTLGITWGLFYGGLFTFAAVLVALQVRRPIFRWPVKIGLIALALLLEIPNLMTLGIVIGSSRAAHAGQRIMDVEAPAFRSATVVGVIIGALLALGVFILVTLVRQRGRQVKALQAQLKTHAVESGAASGGVAPATADIDEETPAG